MWRSASTSPAASAMPASATAISSKCRPSAPTASSAIRSMSRRNTPSCSCCSATCSSSAAARNCSSISPRRVTGRSIGGPAKACIVSSALYGTVSGSPVADVATTGPITIPIMKRLGLSRRARRRDRGVVLDRRRIAAAGDGRGRVPDGGFHRHAVLPDRLVRAAAVAGLLPRRVRARAFRGGAAQSRPRAGGGDRRPASRARAQLAER